MKGTLLSLAAPILVGPIAFAVMQALKGLSVAVDRQTPFVKRLLVAAIAVVLTFIGSLTGIEVSCNADTNCLAVLDHDTVKALVTAAVAYLLHAVKTAKKTNLADE